MDSTLTNHVTAMRRVDTRINLGLLGEWLGSQVLSASPAPTTMEYVIKDKPQEKEFTALSHCQSNILLLQIFKAICDDGNTLLGP